jgi:hypothetical protein
MGFDVYESKEFGSGAFVVDVQIATHSKKRQGYFSSPTRKQSRLILGIGRVLQSLRSTCDCQVPPSSTKVVTMSRQLDSSPRHSQQSRIVVQAGSPNSDVIWAWMFGTHLCRKNRKRPRTAGSFCVSRAALLRQELVPCVCLCAPRYHRHNECLLSYS